MDLRNKEPKHPHPKKMGNGQFNSQGGLEVYKLLWGLQGQVGRTEGMIAFLALSQGAILGRVFGAW